MITRCVFKRFTAQDYKRTALTNQSNAWDVLLGGGGGGGGFGSQAPS